MQRPWPPTHRAAFSCISTTSPDLPPSPLSPFPSPKQARSHVVARAGIPPAVQFNIHGRHVTVDDELEQLVKLRLQPALDLLKGAQLIEGEGGVHDCDVKLM